MSEKTFRAIFQRMYSILLEDSERTHNINMHTFDCFALSEAEAIGKMYLQRSEFRNRKIESINVI